MLQRNISDRLLEMLNERTKNRLREKYGAAFPPGPSPLPPMVEATWLRQIEEFEERSQTAARVTVGEFIGNPQVPPLASLTPEELEEELANLFANLLHHDILILFGRPVTSSEAYRFIAEEILREEIDDLRIPGMRRTFLYEEFHPDDQEDIRMCVEDFTNAFFRGDMSTLAGCIGCSATAGHGAGQSELYQSLIRDRGTPDCSPEFSDWATTIEGCEVTGDTAQVRLQLSWHGRQAGTVQPLSMSGPASIRLARCAVGGWHVTAFECPGLSSATGVLASEGDTFSSRKTSHQ